MERISPAGHESTLHAFRERQSRQLIELGIVKRIIDLALPINQLTFNNTQPTQDAIFIPHVLAVSSLPPQLLWGDKASLSASGVVLPRTEGGWHYYLDQNPDAATIGMTRLEGVAINFQISHAYMGIIDTLGDPESPLKTLDGVLPQDLHTMLGLLSEQLDTL